MDAETSKELVIELFNQSVRRREIRVTRERLMKALNVTELQRNVDGSVRLTWEQIAEIMVQQCAGECSLIPSTTYAALETTLMNVQRAIGTLTAPDLGSARVFDCTVAATTELANANGI